VSTLGTEWRAALRARGAGQKRVKSLSFAAAKRDTLRPQRVIASNIVVENPCMRRAVSVLALAALASVLMTARPSAQSGTQLFTGIGLLDFSRQPDWKVGSWVRYQMSGTSQVGYRDDFSVTLVIGGEEVFWGDTCFWLETWTQQPRQSRRIFAMLLSYSLFDDSLAWARPMLYARKYIGNLNEEGEPRQEVYLRATESLKTRKDIGADRKRNLQDLGPDTVETRWGTMPTRKQKYTYFVGTTQIKGDSTTYEETHETTITHLSDRIPITRIVRQDLERVDSRKSWLIGQSQDAPTRIRDQGTGRVELTGWGSDTTAATVPVASRRPLAEQFRKAPAKSAARPRTS
jgi:hypothetical protein